MPSLLQRLHNAQKQVDYIQREKKAGMRYSIVSHDAVTAKVRPVLNENGIVYFPTDLEFNQEGNRTQVKITVRFVNVDDKDDYIDVPSLGYGIDESDKGPGKAISYGVKYALLKALGLETGDDPDYDQDAKYERNKPASTSPLTGLEGSALATLGPKANSATESLPGASTEVVREYTPTDVLNRMKRLIETEKSLAKHFDLKHLKTVEDKGKALGAKVRSVFTCKTSAEFMAIPTDRLVAGVQAMMEEEAAGLNE